METEIELKFFVLSSAAKEIQKKIASFNVFNQAQRSLSNIYYDTSDYKLRQHDIGLRVRCFDNVCVQTLKTAGRVVAGLHQRPEFNTEIEFSTPDLSLIPKDAWPADLKISQISEQLIPLFSTDFERKEWLVTMPDGSELEIAFDLGHVTFSEDQTDHICEVEIELKSGQMDALFTLARELVEYGGLRLGNLSKAARGYRLAMGYNGDEIKSLSFVQVSNNMNIEQAFIKALEHALSHWHYHEQIYVERAERSALNEMYNALTLIRQSIEFYSDLIPQRASTLLRQELQWLAEEMEWVLLADRRDRLCEDKGYFMRKLTDKKSLRKHFEASNNVLPSRRDMLSLIFSARYCKLLLDLNRWILTRGWRPFLDEKATERLSGWVRDFVRQTMTNIWEELISSFAISLEMDRYSFYENYPKLTRFLISVTAIAMLYNKDACEEFMLPWCDVFQGVEDLHLLDPIRQAIEANPCELEDHQQIDKWLLRKEESIIYAIYHSRLIGLEQRAFWVD